jgi:hypothetical protein
MQNPLTAAIIRFVQAPSAQQRHRTELGVFLDLVIPLIFGPARAGHQRNHPREVGTGRESFVTRAGYNCGAHVVIVGDALPCFG